MAPRPSIKLNGVVLPPHMIAAEAQHHPSQTPAAAFQAAARALVIRTLLLEEAKRDAIAAEPQFVAPGKRELNDEARIRALMEARIPVTEPGEDQCRAFYDANRSRFRSPEKTVEGAERDVLATRIWVGRRTLEDVFLDLTGRSLR